MISGVPSPATQQNVSELNSQSNASQPAVSADVALRFEQMLWAEMLSHAGLEDVLTKNGGEAAAAFSRFVVESIAADIAEKHPLGLSEAAAGSLEIKK